MKRFERFERSVSFIMQHNAKEPRRLHNGCKPRPLQQIVTCPWRFLQLRIHLSEGRCPCDQAKQHSFIMCMCSHTHVQIHTPLLYACVITHTCKHAVPLRRAHCASETCRNAQPQKRVGKTSLFWSYEWTYRAYESFSPYKLPSNDLLSFNP